MERAVIALSSVLILALACASKDPDTQVCEGEDGRLGGIVHDGAGQPVPTARVYGVSQVLDWVESEVDEDGRYELALLPDLEWTIYALDVEDCPSEEHLLVLVACEERSLDLDLSGCPSVGG